MRLEQFDYLLNERNYELLSNLQAVLDAEEDSSGKQTNKARQRERRFYCLFPRTVNCPSYQRVTISPGQEKLLKQ